MSRERIAQIISGMAESIAVNSAPIVPPSVAEECETLGITVNGELTQETERAMETIGVVIPPQQPMGENKPFFEVPPNSVNPSTFSNRFDGLRPESILRQLAKVGAKK